VESLTKGIANQVAGVDNREIKVLKKLMCQKILDRSGQMMADTVNPDFITMGTDTTSSSSHRGSIIITTTT